MSMRPPTDKELESLPHVVLTAEQPWDPSSLDHSIDDDPTWFESTPSAHTNNSPFDEYGELLTNVIVNLSSTICYDVDHYLYPSNGRYVLYSEDDMPNNMWYSCYHKLLEWQASTPPNSVLDTECVMPTVYDVFDASVRQHTPTEHLIVDDLESGIFVPMRRTCERSRNDDFDEDVADVTTDVADVAHVTAEIPKNKNSESGTQERRNTRHKDQYGRHPDFGRSKVHILAVDDYQPPSTRLGATPQILCLVT